MIVLTGMVTTDEVIVSPEIQGRFGNNCSSKKGMQFTNGQLLGNGHTGTASRSMLTWLTMKAASSNMLLRSRRRRLTWKMPS